MTRHDPSRDPVAESARRLYDRRSQHLDGNAALRLRQARRESLAAPAPPARRVWMPLGAASAAALLLALAWWLPPRAGPAQAAAGDSGFSASLERDALASEADSELYAWLGDAPVAPDGGKAGSL